MVNGTRVNVDVEEMRDEEVTMTRTKKRVKPQRIPLDQPPVGGLIRREKRRRGKLWHFRRRLRQVSVKPITGGGLGANCTEDLKSAG
jgi:hypothetical protein